MRAEPPWFHAMPEILKRIYSCVITLYGHTRPAYEFVPIDPNYDDMDQSFLKVLAPPEVDEYCCVETLHDAMKIGAQLGKCNTMTEISHGMKTLNLCLYPDKPHLHRHVIQIVDTTKMDVQEVVQKETSFVNSIKKGLKNSDYSEAEKEAFIRTLPTFRACTGVEREWDIINADESFADVLVCPASYAPALKQLERHIALRIEKRANPTMCEGYDEDEARQAFYAAHPIVIVDEVDKMHTKPFDFNDASCTSPAKLCHMANITVMCSRHIGLSGAKLSLCTLSVHGRELAHRCASVMQICVQPPIACSACNGNLCD